MKTTHLILIIVIILFHTSVSHAQELINACKESDFNKVKELLTSDPNRINEKDNRNCSPLHYASDRGNIEIVKYLLEHKADIDAKDADGDTPLFWAIAGNKYNIAKFLTEKGANVNDKNNQGFNAMHWAAYRSDGKMAKLLIEKGVNINETDYSLNTPLHNAGVAGKPEIAKILIDNKALTDTKNAWGRTPLINTTREHGNLEVIKLLTEDGVNINEKDKYGSSSLQLAAWRGYEPVTDYLISKGAKLPDSYENQLVMAKDACENSLELLFEKLSSEGIIDIIKNKKENNLLIDASKGESEQITENLIDKGFDINGKDLYGWSPLHYASESGNLKIVSVLIKKGANINIRNIMGESPYNIAKQNKHDSLINLFKENKADLSDIKFPILKGPYFGQKLPSDKPEIFALGIVSSKHFHHSPVAFSPDGKTAAWTNDKPIPGTGYSEGDIFWSKIINGMWTIPKPMPFTSTFEESEPFFSFDNKRMYFLSTRPVTKGGGRTKENIWYVEISENGFSDPVLFDKIINKQEIHWQFSFDKKGNVYFGSSAGAGFGENDIYMSKQVDGKYNTPANMGNQINTKAADFSPLISSAGDYMITTVIGHDSLPDGLYLSFKTENGKWLKPECMNDFTGEGVMCSTFSPDEKYMFYLKDYQTERPIFWIKIDEYIAKKKALALKDEAYEHSDLNFKKSDQIFNMERTYNIAFGDIDKDGDIDMIHSNMGTIGSKIWFNNGKGEFLESEQKLTEEGHGAQLADLDNDGDKDIFITCADENTRSKIYFNNGKGYFEDSKQDLGDLKISGNSSHLIDYDNDGDLDAYVVYYQQPDKIYLNNGKGIFTDSKLPIPENSNFKDLDGDGDIDLLIAEKKKGLIIKLNDGKGNFAEYWSFSDTTLLHNFVHFTDIDNDKDIDFIITNGNREASFPTRYFLNKGKAKYKESKQKLPAVIFGRIDSGDINGDGYVDIVISNMNNTNEIWLNDKNGAFRKSEFELENNTSIQRVYFQDLDNDGDLDIIIADFYGGSNEIWFNMSK